MTLPAPSGRLGAVDAPSLGSLLGVAGVQALASLLGAVVLAALSVTPAGGRRRRLGPRAGAAARQAVGTPGKARPPLGLPPARAGVVVATLGGTALVAGEPRLGVVALAAAGAGLGAARAARRRAAARERAARVEAAPAVLDLLGACLSAGLNPHLGLVRVAARAPDALREELLQAAGELELGRTPAAALRGAAERTGIDELRAAAGALEAAERWGTPPAEALAARAEALRSRARLRAEADAGRAAVRLAFPLVFCFLPAFVLLIVVPTVAGSLRALIP